MTDQAPLEVLDDAVHAFAAAIDDEAGAVGIWVLSYERSRVDPDFSDKQTLPLTYSSDYAVGPAGSGSHAIGLLRVISRTIEDAITTPEDDE